MSYFTLRALFYSRAIETWGKRQQKLLENLLPVDS